MWRDLIPACFGDCDLIFALHPLDRTSAVEMFTTALNENANLNDILDGVEVFLNERGDTAIHITEQLQRVRDFYYSYILHFPHQNGQYN